MPTKLRVGWWGEGQGVQREIVYSYLSRKKFTKDRPAQGGIAKIPHCEKLGFQASSHAPSFTPPPRKN